VYLDFFKDFFFSCTLLYVIDLQIGSKIIFVCLWRLLRLQSVILRFLTTELNFTLDFSLPLAVKQFLRSVRNIIISLSFPLKVVSSWPQRGVLIASVWEIWGKSHGRSQSLPGGCQRVMEPYQSVLLFV